MMKKTFLFLTPLLFLVACTRQISIGEFVNQKPEVIYSNFSTALVKAKKAEVILGNEKSFETKISIIQNAKKSLKMIYYIFSDDTSSAYFAEELVKTANRGVKIELLLDLHIHYKNLDYFAMLSEKGNGNIDIRFFGRPGRELMKDVVYLTSSCPKGSSEKNICDRKKKEKIDKIFAQDSQELKSLGISNVNTGYSGQFLSGIYSKDITLLGNSVLEGQKIDISKLKGSGGMSAEDKESLKKIGLIFWKSKFGTGFSKLINKLKLTIAFQVYGDQLNPIRKMFKEYLPLNADDNKQRMREWVHLTDFTHHKLIIADGKTMQLGGRNIENSYHMQPNSQVDKYLFMDTDVYAELEESSGVEVEESFDKLFNYKTMVATMAEVKTFAPTEHYLAKKYATALCKHKTDKEEVKKCIIKNAPNFSLTAHKQNLEKQMVDRAKKYRTQYNPQKHHPLFEKYINDKETLAISKNANLYYVENTPFSKIDPTQRVFGSHLDEVDMFSKGIQTIWIYEMMRACVVSKDENRVIDIYANMAYFFPPAYLLYAMTLMTNGTLDCANVKVHIITNSPTTTDLAPINYAAIFMTKAFLSSLKKHNSKKAAEFNFYEYADLAPNSKGKPASLHSKVMVFDNSIYIGSANMDTRSLVLDTNNGFYITEDNNLVENYKNLLEDMIKDKMIVKSAAQKESEKDLQQLISDTYKKIEPLVNSFNISDKRKIQIRGAFFKIAVMVYRRAESITGNQRRASGDTNYNRPLYTTDELKLMRKYDLLTKEL